MTYRINAFVRALAAAVLAVPLLFSPTWSYAQLPSLGDGGDMSTGAERRLGERIARELYRDPDYIDDPVLAEYVQGIWTRLLAAARVRGELTPEMDDRYAWQVILGRDREINAFALPGGYLGLQLGLIAIVDSPDELASVLGHELSHVTQRHISRLMAQQSRMTPLMIGAMILGALAASKSPDLGGAMITSGQAAAMQGQLNFSRDMEREADRIGYGVMTQAGYAPQAFATMFEKLQQASRLNDNGSFPYLRTHPLTTERIADMQARAQLNATPPLPALSLQQAMITARAQVLSNPGVDALRAAVAGASPAATAAMTPARQAGALYAGALASMKQRNFTQARQLVARLTPLVAGDATAARLANLLAAEVAWAAGDAPRVLALVDPAAPGRPELVLTSEARIRTGRALDAAQRLQTWVASMPRDASAWQLLASAYSAQDETLRAIRAEAEAQVAHLDYAAAVDRFKAAQDLVRKEGTGREPDGHIEASIIDTRLRQVQLLLKEQALEH
ncbi:M48 family metalloprotease [Rhodoferax sediminis]|uniref:Peptidase M48 n=1 Tax=Rhodoferax sediminis TaxID=2509614 RepID=A0A515D6C1_9BURK|nr:M48 family metalloprotease [Rhodoferax sediminis]QDL35965.1 peptidase M48 [Rhodoferax sediminis]